MASKLKFSVRGEITIHTSKGDLTIDNNYGSTTRSENLKEEIINYIIDYLKKNGVSEEEYQENIGDKISPIYCFTDKKGKTYCADQIK
jgi:hypothetical protein